MSIDHEALTRAMTAFAKEEKHWEMLPSRVVGEPVVARRHETPAVPGQVRMPSTMHYVDYHHRSIAVRTDAVMRACMEKAIEAARAETPPVVTPPQAAEVAS